MNFDILELNHIAIECADLENSIRFYTDIIGLQQIPRPNFDFNGAWFALGSQELHLIERVGLPSVKRNNHHYSLKVADVFEAEKALLQNGFSTMSAPSPRPDGAIQLFLTDPDGYVIEIFQPK